ncbi:methionyl-tRNA formyltransferase [Planctomycetes bacterium TBK1r]|uniref:Methionyl-tRNA formyltransferase n=1 Tax=Stieleria magnilauensis TaxID=2527963 RepID=A0ABX5XPI3_9BACT|nr:Methionyl-tRNA formyltransferase [Planctomycetes bacterium TBK1r]
MKTAGDSDSSNQVRVLFAGFGRLGLSIMRNLLASSGEVIVLGMMPASNLSRYRFLVDHPSEIELLQLAHDNHVRILTAPSINSDEFRSELLNLSPDVLLIGSWAEIIKQPVLSIAKERVINCHGSLLPKYRGACPQIATIFNGDKSAGITFHLIDEGIDTGHILRQQDVEVRPRDTAIQLDERIANRFGESVVELLCDFKNGAIVPQKQTGGASYVPKEHPEWAWIPWEEDPEVIDRRIRALHGILPLITSDGQLAFGFDEGEVVKSNTTRINGRAFNLFQIRSQLRPGTVLAVDSENVVVCTRNPDFVVQLKLPLIVQDGQTPPVIRPGERFFSIAVQNILKSA